MSEDEKTRPGANGADHQSIDTPDSTSSRQVSWWGVHEYVQPSLDAAGQWPTAGTPAWCALDDADPVKLAALLDAAQHHALRMETAQAVLADASRAVAASANWTALANDIMAGRGAYIRRAS